MKKIIFILTAFVLFSHAATLPAQEAKSMSERDYKFEISGADYYSTGMFASPCVGELTVGYRINKSVGVNVSGLATNLERQDKSWGAMAGVSAYPRFGGNFTMIPSMGIGVIGGQLDGRSEKVCFAGNVGIEARYRVYRDFQCGLVSKFIGSKGHETFMFGIKLTLQL